MTIGTDPIMFTIGSINVGWHGVLMALAFVAGIYVPYFLAPGAGISRDSILNTAVWVVPGAVIGARLVHVLDNLQYYAANPVAILGFEGLALYGGILGGMFAALICIYRNRYATGKVADLAALGVILGQAVGRVGCLINGDAAGKISYVPWTVTYTHPNAYAPLNVPTQPSVVYEIIWDLLIFGLLFRLRKSIKPDGMIFAIYMMAYSVGRFFISFTRDETVAMAGLHQSQIISIGLFLAGIIVIGVLKKWPLLGSLGARRAAEPVEEDPRMGPDSAPQPPSAPPAA